MSQSFQTGCSDIDLTGSPWNTTVNQDLYVEYKNQAFSFFQDAQCTTACDPPELHPPNQTSVALRFHLLDPDNTGAYFYSSTPITWVDMTQPPQSITYGKILSSKMAFSMKDHYDLGQGLTLQLRFDLKVYVPGSGVIHVNEHIASSSSSVGGEAPVEKVDPTIVEKSHSGGGSGA